LNIKADSGDVHKVIGYDETILYSKFDDQYGSLFDVVKGASGKTYQIAFDLRAYIAS